MGSKNPSSKNPTKENLDKNEIIFALLGTAAGLTRRLDRELSMIKGISFSEYQMLATLQQQPTSMATRVDLAHGVGLTPSGVTRALKPLEKLGFVETVKDGRDARRSLAKLTPAGVELVSDAAAVVEDALDKMGSVGTLTPAEQERFMELLADLSGG